MREKTFTREDTGEKRLIKIRALKRKEIRDLYDCGYDYAKCIPALEKAHEAVDRGLNAVLTKEDLSFLDECENHEQIRCWTELLKETYGSEDEEKNLSATTGGTLTSEESSIAGTVVATKNDRPPA